MLEAIDLSCERGDRTLFSVLNFTLEAGMLLRIDGDNGAGKTTLLRVLCGLLQPNAGDVRWAGQSITGALDECGKHIAYLGHTNGIKEELSAVENIRGMLAIQTNAPSTPIGSVVATQNVMRETLATLAAVGLADFEHVPVRTLSRGQQRRVGLARLFMRVTAPVWVLDEPFAALDAAGVDIVCRRLESELASGRAIVMTTHQEVPLHAPRSARIALVASPA